MNPSKLPFERMIFVCTNARGKGERISCAGEGRCGELLLKKLKAYVKEKGLNDRIRVMKSGCQEQCERGPNAVVVPDNVLLSGLNESDLERVIETYVKPFETTDRPGAG